jgi:FMN reductase
VIDVSTTVLVGNPKSQSRTLDAALLVAERLTGNAPDVVVDVVELGTGLLGWGDERVAEAVAAVTGASLLVVASPTFKATYTGILKLFLDQIPADGLAGVVGIPVMLGAGPGHAMAPETYLKPLLVELGATCPTRSLYLLDSTYRESGALDGWLTSAQAQVTAALNAVVR